MLTNDALKEIDEAARIADSYGVTFYPPHRNCAAMCIELEIERLTVENLAEIKYGMTVTRRYTVWINPAAANFCHDGRTVVQIFYEKDFDSIAEYDELTVQSRYPGYGAFVHFYKRRGDIFYLSPPI